MDSIFCISPIDGRYNDKTKELKKITSEYGLIYYRVLVEIEWFKYLSQCKDVTNFKSLSQNAIKVLDDIVVNFNHESALRVKEIEKTTNHDVKAVEYFIKEETKNHKEIVENGEYIHFACTSEDINNLAYALMLKDMLNNVVIKDMNKVCNIIKDLAEKYKNQPMLARTHGQSASPTTVGKEFANTYVRLNNQIGKLQKVSILGKMNGAVGNYNAHIAAYKDADWANISSKFIQSLGITQNNFTTQIEPHDYMVEIFNTICLFNTILIDFSRDIWGYISMDYFKQKVIANEVGSSTMPHKVNPIDFENAEGNLGMANAVITHMSAKLPISRWQRDLTDSTVLRNIGVIAAYSIIAYKSAYKGIMKLELNEEKLNIDLNNNTQVLGEAIQTVMRRYGINNAYEKLKEFTRGKTINMQELHGFIDSLDLSGEVKTHLKEITPKNYIGNADKFTL